jgi:hypothetical protein
MLSRTTSQLGSSPASLETPGYSHVTPLLTLLSWPGGAKSSANGDALPMGEEADWQGDWHSALPIGEISSSGSRRKSVSLPRDGSLRPPRPSTEFGVPKSAHTLPVRGSSPAGSFPAPSWQVGRTGGDGARSSLPSDLDSLCAMVKHAKSWASMAGPGAESDGVHVQEMTHMRGAQAPMHPRASASLDIRRSGPYMGRDRGRSRWPRIGQDARLETDAGEPSRVLHVRASASLDLRRSEMCLEGGVRQGRTSAGELLGHITDMALRTGQHTPDVPGSVRARGSASLDILWGDTSLSTEPHGRTHMMGEDGSHISRDGASLGEVEAAVVAEHVRAHARARASASLDIRRSDVSAEIGRLVRMANAPRLPISLCTWPAQGPLVDTPGDAGTLTGPAQTTSCDLPLPVASAFLQKSTSSGRLAAMDRISEDVIPWLTDADEAQNCTSADAMPCGEVHEGLANCAPADTMPCGQIQDNSANHSPPDARLCGEVQAGLANCIPADSMPCGEVQSVPINCGSMDARFCGEAQEASSNRSPADARPCGEIHENPGKCISVDARLCGEVLEDTPGCRPLVGRRAVASFNDSGPVTTLADTHWQAAAQGKGTTSLNARRSCEVPCRVAERLLVAELGTAKTLGQGPGAIGLDGTASPACESKPAAKVEALLPMAHDGDDRAARVRQLRKDRARAMLNLAQRRSNPAAAGHESSHTSTARNSQHSTCASHSSVATSTAGDFPQSARTSHLSVATSTEGSSPYSTRASSSSRATSPGCAFELHRGAKLTHWPYADTRKHLESEAACWEEEAGQKASNRLREIVKDVAALGNCPVLATAVMVTSFPLNHIQVGLYRSESDIRQVDS